MTSWLSGIDNNPDWIVYIWFKNYQFKYEQEYMVCDATCLLGEIGGNIGFFLGGSLLEYVNWMMAPIIQKLSFE